ncbi:MAG: hypothetical protein FIA99_00750 [Ruminiclostridium sp.]|nr:hypothetical protein [Ruminiclostridium sp.]
MFYKDIICFANSRKLNGRCVAGKDTTEYKWVRPQSPLSKTGELTLRDITYEDWSEVRVLDIVRIPFGKPAPKIFQPENLEIARGVWQKTGSLEENIINELCDYPDHIWLYGNENDRIEQEYISRNGMESSLLLIKPEADVLVVNEIAFSKQKLKCCFKYNNVQYSLSITDPIYEKEYKNKAAGSYKLPSQGIYLCISLGEPYNGYCYKLVATIITVGD